MTALPAVEDSTLTVYEKSAKHHHRNRAEEKLPSTSFRLLVSVRPEKFSVRVKIRDEYTDGTAYVDVGVHYHWERNLTPRDDLDSFAELTALPQALSCASTLLMDTACQITTDEVPFYGLNALDGMLETFRKRNQSRSLAEMLQESIEAEKSDHDDT